jgi:antitoxin (DNA-binding transcriptional repressor) of toxin-antitoxin stability system
MTNIMAIHEVKDHLSSVIATMTETGEGVAITKHGRIVAMLSPVQPKRVVLGLGTRTDAKSANLEDLAWTPEELTDFTGGPVFPG